jgi:hypothetical protein
MIAMGLATIAIAHRVESLRYNWLAMYLSMGGAFAAAVLLVGQSFLVKSAVIVFAGLILAAVYGRKILRVVGETLRERSARRQRGE